jgi:hypothetical protein
MSSKKPYFGIKPFDEKRKKKYREPSISEAFDAGQIRYYGLHAVSSLLGLLPRMKKSQLKELDKWTKVHYKLPIFKKSEPLPEPEIIKPISEPLVELINEPINNNNDNTVLYNALKILHTFYKNELKNDDSSDEKKRFNIVRLTYRYRDWLQNMTDNGSIKYDNIPDNKFISIKNMNDIMVEIWNKLNYLNIKHYDHPKEKNKKNIDAYNKDYNEIIKPMIFSLLKLEIKQDYGKAATKIQSLFRMRRAKKELEALKKEKKKKLEEKKITLNDLNDKEKTILWNANKQFMSGNNKYSRFEQKLGTNYNYIPDEAFKNREELQSILDLIISGENIKQNIRKLLRR